MTKKSKIRNIVIIIITICFVVFLVYKMATVITASTVLLSGGGEEAVYYYDTVDECILETSKRMYLREHLNDNDFPKSEFYRVKSLISCENDNNYAEIYIASDEQHLWFYLLNKSYNDNQIKYSVEDLRGSVEIQQSGEWNEIGDFAYMTLPNYNGETYYGKKPQVAEVTLKTAIGNKSLCLLLVSISDD